jgi:hypothetical protein
MIIGFATIGLTAVLSTSGSIGVPARSPNAAEFHEGQMFPTMVFPSLANDRPRSVRDFRGKKLILHIFSSW